MGADTKIAWADDTFNPWIGCTHVSEGCRNCYAEADFDKRRGVVKWGEKGTRHVTSDANWAKPRAWNKAAKAAGVKRRVFCASLADVFEDRPELVEPRRRLFVLMKETPNLDWLLLTKRPENIMPMLAAVRGYCGRTTVCDVHLARLNPNLWFGTSIENQETADQRIPILLTIPAAVRFLSCEPLLGPVDLRAVRYLQGNALFVGSEGGSEWIGAHRGLLSWVIAGGESGPHARPMHPDWARSLRDQCKAAGVAFFHKQNGEFVERRQVADFFHPLADGFKGIPGWRFRPEWQEAIRKASKWGTLQLDGTWFPETTTFNSREGDPRDKCEVTMYRVGKAAAGRLLDGREWNEFPHTNIIKG